jgi:CheY-like chemotaxis protein
MNKKPEVLCVDDEPQILEGLKLHLQRHYIVHIATGGGEALGLLEENHDIAVILSDMRMPVMDGAKFLNAARTVAPQAVRMLLTGYTDMQSAIAAVNEGQIFRFISKPCPPDQLLGAFTSALVQHRLIVAEKVLLQQTLLGCVESLAKVLSVTKPTAFGRALRLRTKVRAALAYLLWEDQWQIEAAAVLSQLGAVTLSDETLMKLNEGEDVDAAELREIAGSLDISLEMLGNIPRLEPVLDILRYLKAAMADTPTSAGATLPGAALLRIVLEWDALEAQGLTQAQIFEQLAVSKEQYDTELLGKLKGMVGGSGSQSPVIWKALRDLVPGMVLAQDLVRKNGVVILPRGFEIDRGLLEHIQSFAAELGDDAVKVSTRAA